MGAGNDWTKEVGPGGKHQWKPAGNPHKNIFRLTADLALLEDPDYLAIVEEFAQDQDTFNVAFDEAWFKLTTTNVGGEWSSEAKCDDGSSPVWKPPSLEENKVCDNMERGTPPNNQDQVPTKAAYAEAVKDLDMVQLQADMDALLLDSKDCWPADSGTYGAFMARLAWHCSGTYRNTDGVGGCGGGRMRFEPERSWPDNTNLDKARALLYPLKEKYGDALSWGDLIILAGTTAYRQAGMPVTRMCFGRMDEPDGTEAQLLGPTAEQESKFPCTVNGKCQAPLPTTVGLIYV